MRFIRLLGSLVVFYGLSYLAHAVLQILSLGISRTFRLVAIAIIVLNLVIGIVTVVNGVGLLLSQRWARLSWLVTVTVLVLVHDLILLLWYLSGQPLTGQILNIALTFFMAVISWAKLGDDSAKKYFS